ncbi:PEP-CTERM sorting domain-containing protein [Wenzhouxiangella sp. XN24]|uniref:PEP-CTERM sorting domain-containing protein n=1 Tax=Wenzhouxiangella sp. XN24 TaxID=2713569 RepID=UPI0013EDDE23|nr:PEP-CTERM sorting domain-containing protein [Wenzhouxiangella sp. XN24]NGX17428.1 PEP-CTERM sorting domain-containing protein [Wenzhouxiangella sp. XN24]
MRLGNFLKAVAGAVLLAISAGAHAGPITIEGFTGAYGFENWSPTTIGIAEIDTIGIKGEPDDELGLTCEDTCSIELLVNSNINGSVSFSWDVILADPFYIAGVLEFVLNGVATNIFGITQVFDQGALGLVNEFGSGTFDILAGDVFGFRLTALGFDPGFGDLAELVIGDFRVVGTVPEPGTLALLSLGLLGAGAMRSRRRG